jgi:type III pantothenate kinase
LVEALVTRDQPAPRLDGAIMACVVPELSDVMAEVVDEVFGVPVLTVRPGTRTGLDIRTEDPREVGADRIANAVAAKARLGAPVLVVDFGTSLNVDVVDAEGAYAGTLIAPGLDVAADALAEQTAGLPRVALEPPATAIGTSTAGGLQSGLVLGYVGLVEGLIKAAREEVGPAPVLATGYAAWVERLAARCQSIGAYDPLLTLDGLRRIFAMAAGGHLEPGRGVV